MNINKDVDFILLDMDGTLLDLHYDSHFWLEFIPQQYAIKEGLSLTQAITYVYAQYAKVSGQLNWYCHDHWFKTLGLDIKKLQHMTKSKVKPRVDVLLFLEHLKTLDKRVFMITNAHRNSVEMKMQMTGLSPYFERIISSHDMQIAKENREFWTRLEKDFKVNFVRSLFIDDSEKILKVAENSGVRWLRGINTPDSTIPAQAMQGFKTINLFSELL
ncbi:hydrolase [Psychromonas sp. CNPT3]|uniref:GMP/IMP nucleotidase n=1 Tax=Psychromonas sp. CNPT3 TaxID=314282 RepID=UPI00006E505D|nr:GMP/IMP nucleotidase [Psychromonas sp. CNPT3]AGH82484.1 hydrolase [Psychromonas sp. CNPT3]